MFYRNSTETALNKLKLPDCDFSCPLSDWLTINEKVIPDDWVKECHAGVPHDFVLPALYGKCVYLL